MEPSLLLNTNVSICKKKLQNVHTINSKTGELQMSHRNALFSYFLWLIQSIILACEISITQNFQGQDIYIEIMDVCLVAISTIIMLKSFKRIHKGGTSLFGQIKCFFYTSLWILMNLYLFHMHYKDILKMYKVRKFIRHITHWFWIALVCGVVNLVLMVFLIMAVVGSLINLQYRNTYVKEILKKKNNLGLVEK